MVEVQLNTEVYSSIATFNINPVITYSAVIYLRPYSHDTFWHTILQLKDNFEPHVTMTNQGKLKNTLNCFVCLYTLIFFC